MSMTPIQKALAVAEYYGWQVEVDPVGTDDYYSARTPDGSRVVQLVSDSRGKIRAAILGNELIRKGCYTRVLRELEHYAPQTPHQPGHKRIAGKVFRGSCSCGWVGPYYHGTTGSQGLRDANRHVTSTKPWRALKKALMDQRPVDPCKELIRASRKYARGVEKAMRHIDSLPEGEYRELMQSGLAAVAAAKQIVELTSR